MDEVYLVRKKEPVSFREISPSRFLLQRVRDESHRFPIEYHRKLRSKKAFASPLENIPGIGKKRRLLLLEKFGSLEKIKLAAMDKLQKIPGITQNLAKRIKSIK